MSDDWLKRYRDGLPIYSRGMLEDIDRQLKNKADTIAFEDVLGNVHKFRNEAVKQPEPKSSEKPEQVPRTTWLLYRHIQELTDPAFCNRPPKNIMQEVLGYRLYAWFLTLLFRVLPRPCVRVSHIKPRFAILRSDSISDIDKRHSEYQNEWLESETCQLLRQKLQTCEGLGHIKKIVCFALGGLSLDPNKFPLKPQHTQYAAVQTVRSVIQERTGQSQQLPCFAKILFTTIPTRVFSPSMEFPLLMTRRDSCSLTSQHL